MSDIGLAGIPTGRLKRGASGEVLPSHLNPQFSDFAKPLSKNISTSNTSTSRAEEQTSDQTLKKESEKLSYPMETGNPAYQARVSFRMFSLQPHQDGVSQKSHLSESPVDNTKKSNNVQAFSDDAQASIGPITTSSSNNQINSPGALGGRTPAATSTRPSFIGMANNLKNSALEKGKTFADNLAQQQFVKGVGNVLNGGLKFQKVNGEPIVDMYFPLTFQYNDGAQYEGSPLGITGTVGAAAAEAGASVLGSVLSSMTQGATSTFDALMGNSQLSETAARVAAARAIDVSGRIFNSGFRNALTLQNRTIVNPNVRALFRGVVLREFQFQFKMIAESAAEAAVVEKIVKHFRTQLYPDVYNMPIGSTGVTADLGYKFPNVFQITFNYKNSRNQKLPMIQYCYLRNVGYSVNPTGGGFRRDGQPNEIDLTLAFTEYKTLNKQDVEGGY
tara:strand:- start:11022 stop:12359 length:1338 start_codon:yes stop_codon:yes gene_type:complete